MISPCHVLSSVGNPSHPHYAVMDEILRSHAHGTAAQTEDNHEFDE
jgi:hypothetical protein